MARIEFSLDYYNSHPDCKVETRNGRPVRIICCDAKDKAPIIGLYPTDDGGETTTQNFPDGRWCDDVNYESDDDLFIVTDEPELTDFEEVVSEFAKEVTGYTFQEVAGLRNCARQLMIAAREQLIQEGYIIEKKAFHDAVEKVDPEVMKEVSEKVDKANGLTEFEQDLKSTVNVYVEKGWHMEDWDAREDAKELLEVAHKQILAERKQAVEELMERCKEQGKAEALKDLPRWAHNQVSHSDEPTLCNGNTILNLGWQHIYIDALKRLPGFKED